MNELRARWLLGSEHAEERCCKRRCGRSNTEDAGRGCKGKENGVCE
jgi:hypothetical protein